MERRTALECLGAPSLPRAHRGGLFRHSRGLAGLRDGVGGRRRRRSGPGRACDDRARSGHCGGVVALSGRDRAQHGLHDHEQARGAALWRGVAESDQRALRHYWRSGAADAPRRHWRHPPDPERQGPHRLCAFVASRETVDVQSRGSDAAGRAPGGDGGGRARGRAESHRRAHGHRPRGGARRRL